MCLQCRVDPVASPKAVAVAQSIREPNRDVEIRVAGRLASRMGAKQEGEHDIGAIECGTDRVEIRRLDVWFLSGRHM